MKLYRLGKIGENGGHFLFGQPETTARHSQRFSAVGRQTLKVILDLRPVTAGKTAAGQLQLMAGCKDANHMEARPLSRATILNARFIARPDATDPNIVDANRREQLQPLAGRGNLHSALGGQFQLNRRSGAGPGASDQYQYNGRKLNLHTASIAPAAPGSAGGFKVDRNKDG